MRSSVKKKMITGISKTKPMPSVTLTNKLKYSLIETKGWTWTSRPMPRRNSRPYRNATKYAKQPPEMKSPAVQRMKGTAHFFSRLYKPGEINAQTWYRIQGDPTKTDTRSGSFK